MRTELIKVIGKICAVYPALYESPSFLATCLHDPMDYREITFFLSVRDGCNWRWGWGWSLGFGCFE
jgi:hypothetical protein